MGVYPSYKVERGERSLSFNQGKILDALIGRPLNSVVGPKHMRRIAQRYYTLGDCGIACAAMLSGKSYSEAHKAALELGLRTEDGEYYTYHRHLEKLLKRLGCKAINRKRFVALREVKSPAVVKVNPRDQGRHWHWVVLCEDRRGTLVLLDPKPGRPSRIVSFRGYKGTGHYLHVAQPALQRTHRKRRAAELRR